MFVFLQRQTPHFQEMQIIKMTNRAGDVVSGGIICTSSLFAAKHTGVQYIFIYPLNIDIIVTL